MMIKADLVVLNIDLNEVWTWSIKANDSPLPDSTNHLTYYPLKTTQANYPSSDQ